MAQTDAELMRALHDQHAGALWAFVVRLTGDRMQAQDIVQETLLRAWKHPEVLDPERGSPRGWLFTVARRLVVDDWRTKRSRVEMLPGTLPEHGQVVVDGKLKALGITALKSTELMPGVKSVSEQGVPDFEVTGWNAFYAPRDTPKPVIDFLNGELAKALALPETRKRMLELGFDTAGGTPADLAKFEAQERTKWGPVIKATGLQGG